ALYTRWAGDAGSNGQYSNVSDCSFFADAVEKRAYNWRDAGLATWLCGGACPVGRPQAKHYYDAIAAGRHFTRLTNVTSLAKGDVIALKYSDTNTNTGHVMFVDGPALLKCSSCTPGEYTISVVDSSK